MGEIKEARKERRRLSRICRRLRNERDDSNETENESRIFMAARVSQQRVTEQKNREAVCLAVLEKHYM